MKTKGMTLNQTLKVLGYTTAPHCMYAKHILNDGEIVFSGDAQAVWDWLHETHSAVFEASFEAKQLTLLT